ncbi:hypothetical protein CPU12_01300 [Malaciobacter molluscorum LMG 25693]|uniref:Uncharacterized protein n=1 Tax=Malaciobacter molluscorum LMG 25693 TaxID=870501 RepID=A0A2G1DM38_9BACT|nr:DUF3820 family protein [Malaciobacter molluscorum]AXX92216.1 hypothetical protein AMOL_1235 [Malaciobacter molluscorum LMG 25693]PHO19444.1 hypothetical protein CPU12_01300 [Malaciobacter molluscorum LMG 25693]
MWFIAFIFWGFMLASWIKPYFPKDWLIQYPDLAHYVSFISIFLILFYIYFLRPFLREVNGERTIDFGKYKGRKWKDIPTEYLQWVSQTYNDYSQAGAYRELRRRKKLKKKEFKHKYQGTILGIIETNRTCWKCKKTTTIIAIKFYTKMNEDDIYDTMPSVAHYIKYLPNDILEKIQTEYPFFKYKYSHTINEEYIANCCIHCDSLQGDWELHEEPQGKFFNSHKMKCKKYIVNKNDRLEFSKRPLKQTIKSSSKNKIKDVIYKEDENISTDETLNEELQKAIKNYDENIISNNAEQEHLNKIKQSEDSVIFSEEGVYYDGVFISNQELEKRAQEEDEIQDENDNFIHFGKYKGKKWEKVPSSYLNWVVDNFDGIDERYYALEELKRRV